MHFLFFVLGSCFGSFLCVIAERSVRAQNWVHGRSHCQRCGRLLHWYETVPIVSYLALRGRCRECRKPIPVSTLLSECAGGFLLWIIYWRFGASAETVLYGGIGFLLLLIACTDAFEGHIYDRHLFILGLFIPAVLYFSKFPFSWVRLAVFLCWIVFSFLVGPRMGEGDKYLIAIVLLALPWFWQWRWLLYSVWSAFFPSLILLIKGHSKKTAIPFVPYLLAGYLLLWLFPGGMG